MLQIRAPGCAWEPALVPGVARGREDRCRRTDRRWTPDFRRRWFGRRVPSWCRVDRLVGEEVEGAKGEALARREYADLKSRSDMDWISGRHSSCLVCQLTILKTVNSPDRVVCPTGSTRGDHTRNVYPGSALIREVIPYSRLDLIDLWVASYGGVTTEVEMDLAILRRRLFGVLTIP